MSTQRHSEAGGEHTALARASALTVEAVTALSHMAALHTEWDALAEAYPPATVFQRSGYLRAWWRAFGDGRELCVLTVRRGARLVAILPLIRQVWCCHGVPLRQLSFLHNHHALRGDGLFGDEPEAALEAALKFLHDRASEWDVIYLNNVPEVSPLYHHAQAAAAASGLRCDAWLPGRMHRFLPFQASWEQHLEQRSANFRWQTKKSRRRLDQLGTARFERAIGQEGLLRALPEVFELERSAWQGGDATTAMSGADHAFCRALIEEMPGEAGQIWLLRLDGRSIASVWLLQARARLFLFTSYYDSAYAAAAPGALLFYELIGRSWGEGFEELDFNGNTHAFQRYTPSARPHHGTRIYAPSMKGRAASASRAVLRHARHFLGRA